MAGAAYAEWVRAYVARTHSIRGKCYEAADEMALAFPELKVVYGWVECEEHPRWPHWYLRAPGGEIVDPTAGQFQRIERYGEFGPDEPQLSGRCPVCATFVYDYAECCVLV